MGRASRLHEAGLAVALMIGCGAAIGCAHGPKEDDLEQVGQRDSSSELLGGVLRPVAADDLVSVHDRGRLLHQLEKTLHMAYVDGMMTVGDPGTDAVLPLVDVDPGGRSAQAVFVRWRPGADGQRPVLSAATAERWLLVSMLLTPDRVVDVEILQGPVAPGTHTATRIDTVLAAAERARTLAPGVMFHLFDLYEQVPTPAQGGKKGKGPAVIGHVYAFSADAEGADLELKVSLPQRRQPATVLEAAVVHADPKADPMRIETPSPGPMTVARAMLRGLDAGSVTVQSPQGDWVVVAGTGLVRRADKPGTVDPP